MIPYNITKENALQVAGKSLSWEVYLYWIQFYILQKGGMWKGVLNDIFAVGNKFKTIYQPLQKVFQYIYIYIYIYSAFCWNILIKHNQCIIFLVVILVVYRLPFKNEITLHVNKYNNLIKGCFLYQFISPFTLPLFDLLIFILIRCLI